MRILSCQKRSRKPALKTSRNGYILFSLLIIGTLVGCIAMSVLLGLKGSLKNAGVQRIQGNAFNIAEAGKEHALSLLRLNSAALTPNQDSDILTNIAFDIGSYTVRCITNATMDTIVLRSKGIAGARTATVEVKCLRSTILAKMSYTFPAAVVAKSNVATSGNITIDGNDWDSTNSSIIGTGIYAISTCGSVSQGGSSNLYGRGYTSGTPPLNEVVNDSADSSGYPTTPEEVLGVSLGSLDSFKTSSLPSTPFHGIVYVDWPGSGEEKFDLNGSSGIFIFHNSTYSAILKPLHGDFKGIIICDQIRNLNSNGTILGAIVTLSSTASHTFGNGTPYVRYSSQVLNNLDKYINNVAPSSVDVISWREI